MKIHKFLILFVSTLFLLGCKQDIKPQKNPFAGLWTIDKMELKDVKTGKWNTWRSGMQGYVLYDDSENMAIHLTAKDYQKTALKFPNFTDTIAVEALKHLTNSYVYFAKYTVFKSDKIIEHARISHSNPAEWKAIVKRRYAFSGNTLILSPIEEKNAGLRIILIKDKE